jgi:AbrB family looped-hinge helix DNA binding protein
MTETRKGQVTIPKLVRDRLGINPGSKVDFEVAEDGRAYLRPRTNRGAQSDISSGLQRPIW